MPHKAATCVELKVGANLIDDGAEDAALVSVTTSCALSRIAANSAIVTVGRWGRVFLFMQLFYSYVMFQNE
jgi:hypothetical protein